MRRETAAGPETGELGGGTRCPDVLGGEAKARRGERAARGHALAGQPGGGASVLVC